jgi:hypothetical protein
MENRQPGKRAAAAAQEFPALKVASVHFKPPLLCLYSVFQNRRKVAHQKAMPPTCPKAKQDLSPRNFEMLRK